MSARKDASPDIDRGGRATGLAVAPIHVNGDFIHKDVSGDSTYCNRHDTAHRYSNPLNPSGSNAIQNGWPVFLCAFCSNTNATAAIAVHSRDQADATAIGCSNARVSANTGTRADVAINLCGD